MHITKEDTFTNGPQYAGIVGRCRSNGDIDENASDIMDVFVVISRD